MRRTTKKARALVQREHAGITWRPRQCMLLQSTIHSNNQETISWLPGRGVTSAMHSVQSNLIGRSDKENMARTFHTAASLATIQVFVAASPL